MANIVRSAKSGSDWTRSELDSYHITIHQVDHLLFFGLQELPQPVIDQELLNILDADTMQQDRNAELIGLLDLAMIPDKGETAVDDFAVELFKVLGYVRRQRLARTRVDLPLLICGGQQFEPVNARAQLVAEAVAAFNENNAQRESMGLPPLVSKVMPGIVMVGTSPAFFKIPVTQTLSDHIAHGTYPPAETQVTYCYPPVPRPARRRSEGMKPLDNRREMLKCYEAFKAIVGI
ncbi:uncharacterized protein EI90DRAFT_3119778 [Cantharellus anzutake]|uniref:uncharacterized protein n=1 Tax=Cantharellus anzutake TaxID=1750568 RepID=UPI0019073897|nr:uncharacterized protein EI90DRAFT_3119778 [Cantharellus anzutake]KAF8336529.1 hypothetical protein EI90DRAFT_3119778 [Cantharellus anzutake]